MSVVVEERREGLAHAGAVHPVPRAGGEAGNERALKKPLRIDHGVVALRRERSAERRDFTPDWAFPQGAAPAAQRYRNDPLDAGVHAGDAGEAFLDHPVDSRSGKSARRIGDGRALAHHVPERGRLDDKEPFTCRQKTRRWSASPRPAFAWRPD